MRYIINKIAIIVLMAISISGCQQEIDDYFVEETEASVDTDIFSYIKENADYSKFVSVLEQYEIDTLLDKGNVYTFFIPNNAAMENVNIDQLDIERFVGYLITESLVNLNQISEGTKIQTLSGKFADVKEIANSTYTIDGVDIVKGSSLTNNGRYYEIDELVFAKPSLYEYIAETNEFYRQYIDSRDSVYPDPILSTPIGYTDDGRTIFDTVFTNVNLFEMEYFPISYEFRDYSATMLLFSQQQYDDALQIITNELGLPADGGVPEIWQSEILMPYLLEQSVFRNSLNYTTFVKGKAKNILGDSVSVYPENIEAEFFQCSNGRAFNLIDFKVPESLYKVNDTIPIISLLYNDGGVLKWKEGFEPEGQTFDPIRFAGGASTFGSNLLIDMGKNFTGDFSFDFSFQTVFPATYKLTLRANLSKTGVYNIFVNGKQYPIDINDGNGPQMDFDFFNLRDGVVSSVTYEYYPFVDNSCSFDILVDNITEFGDVEVKIVYVEPSRRNQNNCGINIDFVSLDYFNNEN